MTKIVFAVSALLVAAPAPMAGAPIELLPAAYKHCPEGTVLVKGHHDKNGRWVAAHCRKTAQ